MNARLGIVVAMFASLACTPRSKEEGTLDVGIAPPSAAPAALDPRVAICDHDGSVTAQSACIELGDKYSKLQDGGIPDPKKGASYYVSACDKGARLGCRNLAILYVEGRGVEMNRVKAIELFDRSCAAGLDLGCEELGELYDKGKAGGSIDTAKGVNAYQRGCDLGSGRACRELGRHYKDGSGVPKDVPRGIKLYEKACETDRLSCDDLGDVYFKGLGVPSDKAKAALWYGKGCTAGLEMACEHQKAMK